eukprot:5650241-Amphidinium_carterae.1
MEQDHVHLVPCCLFPIRIPLCLLRQPEASLYPNWIVREALSKRISMYSKPWDYESQICPISPTIVAEH